MHGVIEKFNLLHNFLLLTLSECEWSADEERCVCLGRVPCIITNNTLQNQESLTQDD